MYINLSIVSFILALISFNSSYFLIWSKLRNISFNNPNLFIIKSFLLHFFSPSPKNDSKTFFVIIPLSISRLISSKIIAN